MRDIHSFVLIGLLIELWQNGVGINETQKEISHNICITVINQFIFSLQRTYIYICKFWNKSNIIFCLIIIDSTVVFMKSLCSMWHNIQSRSVGSSSPSNVRSLAYSFYDSLQRGFTMKTKHCGLWWTWYLGHEKPVPSEYYVNFLEKSLRYLLNKYSIC